MSMLVFAISVSIALALLIYHSVLANGKKYTLEFFGGGFLFGFIREWYMATFADTYAFPQVPLQILGVPIFIPVGWVFTFYLGVEFTKRLITIRKQEDYIDFIICASFFADMICVPIETAALNMGWWEVYMSFPLDNAISVYPLMTGWWLTSMLFLSLFFTLTKRIDKSQLVTAILITLTVPIYQAKPELVLVLFVAIFLINVKMGIVTFFMDFILFILFNNYIPGLLTLTNSGCVLLTFIFQLAFIFVLFVNREKNVVKRPPELLK